MSILPKDYIAPQGAYTKITQAITSLRILSPEALTGYELWIEKKPVRKAELDMFTSEELRKADTNKDGTRRQPKHFYAFVVWNNTAKRLQVYQASQKSVQESIVGIEMSWGNMREYDIEISKTGEGMETRYKVLPAKPSPLAPEILKAYKDAKIDLTELLRGGDPFTKSSEKVDPNSIPDFKI